MRTAVLLVCSVVMIGLGFALFWFATPKGSRFNSSHDRLLRPTTRRPGRLQTRVNRVGGVVGGCAGVLCGVMVLLTLHGHA